jgi:hypothetical protein
MSERPAITISLPHDHAMVISGLLAEYFYGRSILEGRLTPVQADSLSELLTQLEKCPAVSTLALGDRFMDEVQQSAARIQAHLSGKPPVGSVASS